MRKIYSADWRAITCNEDEEQFATKAETERVVREHTDDHEDVIALIYHNNQLKSVALWASCSTFAKPTHTRRMQP